MTVASIIGVPSGFFGGKYDIIIQRFVDAWMAFPSLLVLLTVMSVVGRGMTQIVVVIGILSGIGWSRVVRSAVIGIKENDYFLAAHALGSTSSGTVRATRPAEYRRTHNRHIQRQHRMGNHVRGRTQLPRIRSAP